MSKTYYPIALGLAGRRVLVAGAGVVAERKVKTLLEFNARIKVVSPAATAALKSLARSGDIRWLKREVRASDLKGADIVIAATSDAKINEKISRWAAKNRILVNVVDKPKLSDFISPAVFKKNNAVVAVYTDGRDPVLSRDLKNFLKERWDEFLSYRRGL